MKITIEIKPPPDGYSIPERRPVYLPFDDTLILIGDCWQRTSEVLTHGGESHICCRRIKQPED